MQAYTIDGPMGELLDAESDGLALSPFTVFENEELMNMGDKWALPILLYLFYRIEKSLHGQPAWIFLDEAWILISRQIEIISSAVPKNEYYLVSEQGSRLFSFAIGPLAMSFVGVSDRESVQHIMQLEKQFGEQWIEQWLRERGLSLTDYASAS